MVTEAFVTPACPLHRQPADWTRQYIPLIYEIHQVARSDRRHVCDTKDETDGIKDIGFSRTVQSSDGIERLVETWRSQSCKSQKELLSAYL